MVKDTARCTAQIHPQDSLLHGIKDGQTICLSSKVGAISIPAEVTNKVMQGVVYVPHGWGLDKEGVQLQQV